MTPPDLNINLEGRVSLRKLAGIFAEGHNDLKSSFTLSYSNYPVLRRPNTDEMQVDLTVSQVYYRGIDALAFFFQNLRQVDSNEQPKHTSEVHATC